MTRLSQVPKWRTVNGTQLANIIGVSSARISNLVHAGLPRIADSKLYDLAQVVPWLTQRTLEKGDVQGTGSARQLYFEAMTERAQLDTEKLRGNLYGRPEVDQFLMGVLVQVREHCLALPERVTRDRTTAAKLDSEIASALEAMADAIATFVETGKPGPKPAKATPKKKRGRVGKRQPANPKRIASTGKIQKRNRAVSG